MKDNQKSVIDTILMKDENLFFEVKSIRKKPSDLIPTIVAFWNTEWWILVLGIEDKKKETDWKKRILWISENPEHFDELQRLIPANIQPFLEVDIKKISVTNSKGEEDQIAIIEIPKSKVIHSIINGDTYIRTEKWNKKIWNIEITRLKYEKWTLSRETEPTNIDTLESIDIDIFDDFKKSVQSNQTDWQILKDNWLSTIHDWKQVLNIAWALLFLKNPSVHLAWKYGIKISHYYGKKAEYTGEPNFVRRPFSIEWTLIKQIFDAVAYFQEIVRNAPPSLKDSTFQTTYMIPERAFQEVIVNAVIHRNYAIQDDIHVRIFDDRIEVKSPWTYPWHITPANILNERFARNPLILRSLNRFSRAPNLDIWEWVNRLYEVMRKHNLYEPIYLPKKHNPHAVEVWLFNLQKIEYRESVSGFLMSNPYITNEIARSITWISDTLEMSRLLKSWEEKWLIISKWKKRYTKYRLATREDILFSDRLKIES